MKPRISIILPTLNEAKNISRLYKLIKKLKLKFFYLFIDDGSNDGTQKVLRKIKKNNPKQVFIIQRKKREGIGKAHKDGLLWSYKKKFNFTITMDTDFAHHPNYIRPLLKKVQKADLVIGSRYIKKKSVPNWSLFRVFLSSGAHLVSYILFKHKFDSTNAFRCYNLNKINKNFIFKCKSNDYDFFFTSLALLNLRKYEISEIPMTIKGRTEGNSKMYIRYMFKSVFMMFNIFLKIKFNYLK